ncbi:YkvA family protein [Pseudomonas sp. GCM10022188]|uniref:YkvA family protein n=1 Tax=Pseudomonas TaxID=286 RepID=UPI001E6577AE|nr:YkvA family protein [Pseudomonas oryzagri]MCC6075632.1 DUF1232 domain-containing protein [Pseudomonas oryzagri]
MLKKALDRTRQWARSLKRQVMVLWFCARHPDTPWAAKLLALAVVAYALSPIDLIPDFIPVLGYLDDVILLPLGILLALRLIPAPVFEACRQQAQAWEAAGAARPRSRLAAVLIVALWLLLGTWLAQRYLF